MMEIDQELRWAEEGTLLASEIGIGAATVFNVRWVSTIPPTVATN